MIFASLDYSPEYPKMKLHIMRPYYFLINIFGFIASNNLIDVHGKFLLRSTSLDWWDSKDIEDLVICDSAFPLYPDGDLFIVFNDYLDQVFEIQVDRSSTVSVPVTFYLIHESISESEDEINLNMMHFAFMRMMRDVIVDVKNMKTVILSQYSPVEEFRNLPISMEDTDIMLGDIYDMDVSSSYPEYKVACYRGSSQHSHPFGCFKPFNLAMMKVSFDAMVKTEDIENYMKLKGDPKITPIRDNPLHDLIFNDNPFITDLSIDGDTYTYLRPNEEMRKVTYIVSHNESATSPNDEFDI